MRKHSVSLVLAVVASILMFSLLFVSFRARAFHYCMGFQEQPRVVSIDEPCSSEGRGTDRMRRLATLIQR
jgi:hypothetical protein